MEEQLLQFIWHRRHFSLSDLRTTSGEVLSIIDPGTPNADQGPDFLHARIRIGDHVWIGHVEIHVRSSAWFLHAHDRDEHYNNVILHVVWVEDRPVITADGFRPPCLELGFRVDAGLLTRYRRIMNQAAWVPCAPMLPSVPARVRTTWLARLMAARLEARSSAIEPILARTQLDWEQTFFIWLARHIGAPANADALEALATRLPLRVLRKHGDRPDQVEALLFGTAGMLSAEGGDPYVRALTREFSFLRRKYGLRPMEGLAWRFLRMRPPHFPTLRLAQLAAILMGTTSFMELVDQALPLAGWRKVFRKGPAHPFWTTHYHFAESAPASAKILGRGTADSLVLNVVAPIAFLYGRHQGSPVHKDYGAGLWQALPPELHSISRGWAQCGWKARDAGESQALLHLRRHYCAGRRCLRCAVGLYLLRTDES